MKAQSPGAVVRSILAGQLKDQGFFAQGFITAQSFLSVLDEMRISAEIRDRYGASETRSLAAVAFNYSSGPEDMPAWAKKAEDAPSAHSEPRLAIARFARANWYAEINQRLLAAVKATRIEAASLGIELPGVKAWKRLVNSMMPEKALAFRAGLGWIGKNTILIASGSRGESSAVLLGLLLCPIDLDLEESLSRTTTAQSVEALKNDNTEWWNKALKSELGCGSCNRCVDACPTGALGSRGSFFERKKCIQHWTHIDEEPPASMLPFLSGRLYGCDICLEACPYFNLDEAASCNRGALGPAIPARALLDVSESELKNTLRDTTLDRSWISLKALRRNAALSLESIGREKSCGDGQAKENPKNDH
jgi:epoxyqueuosine reductase